MIVHSPSCGATWPADFLRGSVSDADGKNEEEPEGCYYNCEQRWQVYTAVFGYHRPLPSWCLLRSLESMQDSIIGESDDAVSCAILRLNRKWQVPSSHPRIQVVISEALCHTPRHPVSHNLPVGEKQNYNSRTSFNFSPQVESAIAIRG